MSSQVKCLMVTSYCIEVGACNYFGLLRIHPIDEQKISLVEKFVGKVTSSLYDLRFELKTYTEEQLDTLRSLPTESVRVDPLTERDYHYIELFVQCEKCHTILDYVYCDCPVRFRCPHQNEYIKVSRDGKSKLYPVEDVWDQIYAWYHDLKSDNGNCDIEVEVVTYTKEQIVQMKTDGVHFGELCDDLDDCLQI